MNEPYSIPSFYQNSYVQSKYSLISEKSENKNENILTDYDSTHHVRIMKRFQTPAYECSDENEMEWLNGPSQREFFLRCYLPKNKISHIDRLDRIKHVIVMFNGLNEIMKYDFYDLMGAQFAEHGIATILLPTPFHLNRRIYRQTAEARSMIDVNDGTYEMPTDIAFGNPALYFFNFKRSIMEFESLVERIKNPDKEDHGFFESYFVREPQITLFGFSLGGLRALGSFLKHPKRYHSCITFNTSVNLKQVDTKDLNLDPTVWKATFDDLKEMVRRPFFAGHQENYLLDVFSWLYLGDDIEKLTTKLTDNSSTFLSIQSGADTLAKESTAMSGNIIDPNHGLNRLVVAGVGHVPTMDFRWDNWLSKVGENIVHFINGCKEVHWAHKNLETDIQKLIKETPFFRYLETFETKEERTSLREMNFSFEKFEELKGQLESEDAVKSFTELYYVSKAFYPKFSELLEKITRPEK